MLNKWRLGLSLIFLILAGCAGTATTPAASREEVVSARAQARWDSLLKNDLKAAYGFMTPGSRQVQTEEQFASRIKPGLWQGAKVKSVTCRADPVCDVVVIVGYAYSQQGVGVSNERELGETWIREADTWWFSPQR